jgi:uncharacterized protein (TIGR04255 family)
MKGQQETFPHLKKAPITEAIIDFRVRLAGGFEIERFKEAHPQFQKEYPHAEEQEVLQQKFPIAHGKPASCCVKDLGIQGYRFHSADQKNIIQFRRDGFTFNRLHPYTSWDEIFPEASRFWSLYVQIAAPEELTRIAVRYINRLSLPALQLNFADYLRAPPRLPQGVPQAINGFITRVAIHDPETMIAATVVQALETPLDEQYVSLILDIDVFQQNLAESPPAKILERFADLREMKNRIFFGSLTTKALALFE